MASYSAASLFNRIPSITHPSSGDMDDEKMVDSIKMRQDRRQMTQKIWLHWRWRILYPLRAIAIVIGFLLMPPLLAKDKDSPSRATGLGAAFALAGVGLVPVPFLVSRRVRQNIPHWCFWLCLISCLVGSLNMFINIGFGTFDPHSAEAIAGLVLVCVLILGYGMVVAWCSASVERPAGLSGNRSEPTMDMLNTVFPKDERTPYAHQPSSLLNVFSSEDLSRTEAHCEVAKPEHCYRSVSEYPLCAGPHNYPSRVQTPWR